MPEKRVRRRSDTGPLLAIGLVAAAIAVGVLYTDRPLALWIDGHVTGSTGYVAASAVLRPLDAVLLAGIVLLVGTGAWTLSGRRMPAWARRLVQAELAAVLALVVTVLLKLAIGRTQLYPAFLRQGVYAFRPFGGYPAYAAFPSATMSVSAAFLAGLDWRRPAGRTAAVLVLVVLAAALLATSSHWASDVVGGGYLGLVLGAAVRRRAERRRASARAPTAAAPT